MRRVSALICVTLLGLFLTGCTSAVSLANKGGLDQEIKITSDPPGAEVFLMGSIPLGETPLLNVKIDRTKNTFLTFKKEGLKTKISSCDILSRRSEPRNASVNKKTVCTNEDSEKSHADRLFRDSTKFGRWAGRISRESIGNFKGAGI